MKHQWSVGAGIVFALSTALCGCWVETYSDPEAYDEIVTVYDPDYDFTGNKTYAMPERIFDLSNLVEDSVPMDFDHEDTILNEIADQMAALGYDRIADPRSDEADVVLAVGAVTQQDWAYGYYWYGYYYYYPTVYVEWEVGTVLITMLNPKEVEPDINRVPVVWAGGLRGFADYYRTDSEISGAIAQAFKQSPYLEVGPSVPSEPGLEDLDAGDETVDGGVE